MKNNVAKVLEEFEEKLTSETLTKDPFEVSNDEEETINLADAKEITLADLLEALELKKSLESSKKLRAEFKAKKVQDGVQIVEPLISRRNKELYYVYDLQLDINNEYGFHVSLRPEFKEALDKNEPYIWSGVVLWKPNQPLPNPGSSYKGYKVVSLNGLFKGVKAEVLHLRRFTTGNCYDFSDMFRNCKNLKYLDLSGFNFRGLEFISGFTRGCRSLRFVDLKTHFTKNVDLAVANVTVSRSAKTEILF